MVGGKIRGEIGGRITRAATAVNLGEGGYFTVCEGLSVETTPF